MQADAERYEQQLASLVPRGRIWPTEPGSKLRALLRVLAEGLVRVHLRALALIEEADVRTTVELLPDWERVLGLPEDCAPAGQTFAERRDAAVAKFNRIGGASRGYFTALALELGFVITIREYGPDDVQDPVPPIVVDSEEWAHTWEVTAPEFTLRVARVNELVVQEPLRSWGNEVLECFFAKLKPAQSQVIHVYV